ncbi:MAG: hypothetical protein LC687_03465 [Actinobacteria bacterium]|nr:hypothetical protein [Actinomycetota bacterium]
MANLSDSLVEVSQALYQHLLTGRSTLGLQDVWYDTKGVLPRTPAILIEPDNKARELMATGHQTSNTFQVGVVVVHSRMAASGITNKEVLELAENVETYIHTNRSLDGLLIHSYIVSIEQGSVTQQSTVFRATRLLWQGISRTRI